MVKEITKSYSSKYLIFLFAFVLFFARAATSVFLFAYEYLKIDPSATFNQALGAALQFRYAGDIGYYPQLVALASGNFHEPVMHGVSSNNWTSFPIMSSVLFVLGTSISGPLGLIITDALAGFISFAILYRLLKVCGISTSHSFGASLLLCLGAVNYFSSVIHSAINISGSSHFWVALCLSFIAVVYFFFHQKIKAHHSLKSLNFLGIILIMILASDVVFDVPAAFWNQRLYRPLGSQLFFYLFLLGALVYCSEASPKSKTHIYAGVCGVSLSCFMQGDLHGFIAVFLATGGLICLLLGKLISQPKLIGERLKSLGIFCVSFLISSIFFIVQQLTANPELVARFGAISIPRYPLLIPDNYQAYMSAGILSFAHVILYRWSHSNKDKNKAIPTSPSQKLALICGLVFLCSFVAPIFLQVFAGKTVQQSQFLDRIRSFATIYSLSLFLLTCSLMRSSIKATPPLRPLIAKLNSLFLPSTLLVGFLLVLFNTWSLTRKTNHIRSNYSQFVSETNYRESYFELLAFLRTIPKDSDVTLATMDSAVYSWWSGWNQRSSYLGDPFASVVSDDILEKRLLSYFMALDLDWNQIDHLLDDFMVQTLWFGHLKYQPTKYLLTKDFNDFRDDQRLALDKLSYFDCWDIQIPITEKNRLALIYKELQLHHKEHDDFPDYLLKWSNDGIDAGAKFYSNYKSVFKNKRFEVWKLIDELS